MSIDFSQRPAPVVYSLEDRVPERVPPSSALYLEDVLATIANIREAGFHVGDEVDQVEAINPAIEATLASPSGQWLDATEVLSVDPTEVAERVRQAGIDLAAREEITRYRNAFQMRLARVAADALAASSAAIVAEMRERFVPAVEAVQAAADRGITAHTDPADLLKTATMPTITTFRALVPAVTVLDGVAHLRNQLGRIAGGVAARHPVAAYLARVDSIDALEGAADLRGRVAGRPTRPAGQPRLPLRQRPAAPRRRLMAVAHHRRLRAVSQRHGACRGRRPCRAVWRRRVMGSASERLTERGGDGNPRPHQRHDRWEVASCRGDLDRFALSARGGGPDDR